MKITKVYTRTGDDGTTGLVGGDRIKKSHVRLEAYGTVDELNSQLGLLVATMPECAYKAMVERIQNVLFNVGTYLATDLNTTPLYPSARLPEGETEFLENEIDAMREEMPFRGFVLPGGARSAAVAHVCRAVCRRAERRVFALADTTEIAPEITKYLNRLSDFLFVLASKLNIIENVEEKLWDNPCK